MQAYFSGHEHDLQYHHLQGESTHYIVSGAGSLTDYPPTYYPGPRSRFLHQGSGVRPRPTRVQHISARFARDYIAQ